MKPSLRFAILKNLGLALLLVGVENLLIFSGIGFSTTGTSGGHLVGPIPGWFIGLAWTALFSSLGVVLGLLEADGSPAGRRARRAVLTLLIACAAYPFYTIGLHNRIVGFFGDMTTICLSVWVAARIGRVRRIAVIAPLAVIGWVAFATVASIDEGRLRPAEEKFQMQSLYP